MLQTNLRWDSHTEYICARAASRLWTLRRLRALGLDTRILFNVYAKEIRSILEMAVPVWHSGLTLKQSKDIEKIQRISFSIILGLDMSYRRKCELLGTQTLAQRRMVLCSRYIQRAAKSQKFSDLLHVNSTRYDMRPGKKKFTEFQCTSNRAFMSPLCYLTRLLNSEGKS